MSIASPTGTLPGTPSPITPPAQPGAAANAAPVTPTGAAPTMYLHQPVNIDLPHWTSSAEDESTQDDSDQDDSSDDQQYLQHTPPNTNPRSAANSIEESSDVDDADDSESAYNDSRGPRAFGEVFKLLLNGSHSDAFSTGGGEMIEIKTPTKEELQALTRAISTSTTLRCLKLPNLICKGLVAAVTEGMASNTSVHMLVLQEICGQGDGALLATMLKSNPHLKSLDISHCSGMKNEDFLAIVAVLKDHHTLQNLHAGASGAPDDIDGYGKALIEPLAANKGLQTLSLPHGITAEALDALAGVLAIHPTLHDLDLGQLPSSPSFAPALARAMTSAARLTTLRLDLGTLGYEDEEEAETDSDGSDKEAPLPHDKALLNAIGQCPALTALEIVDIPNITNLRDFLKVHPRIQSVALKDEDERDDVDLNSGLTKFLAFARSSNQLIHFSYEGNSPYHSKLLLAELKKQTALNRANHAQTIDAGMGISVMLGVQANEPIALPDLPPELTLQLAAAVLENLSPADAKTVFDTVAPYGQVGPKEGE